MIVEGEVRQIVISPVDRNLQKRFSLSQIFKVRPVVVTEIAGVLDAAFFRDSERFQSQFPFRTSEPPWRVAAYSFDCLDTFSHDGFLLFVGEQSHVLMAITQGSDFMTSSFDFQQLFTVIFRYPTRRKKGRLDFPLVQHVHNPLHPSGHAVLPQG